MITPRLRRSLSRCSFRSLSALFATFALCSLRAQASPPATSFTQELQRLRSSDHFFHPQAHRLAQQSGFSRSGDNPDRLDFLYREGDWMVYADQHGPGVVSRIWATHGDDWQPIRIEVDDRVLYEGTADGFFGMNRAPFVAPLCEIRSAEIRQVTAEKETGRRHVWGVSYVPIPFQKRFRLLQKKQLYTNVDFKLLPAEASVDAFPRELSPEEQRELDRTLAAWKRAEPEVASAAPVTRTEREFALAPHAPEASADARLELAGPGIIREIRLLSPAATATLGSLWLEVGWDGASAAAISVPLDTGLGSLAQHTFALGRAADGWQFLRLPMPFRRAAWIRVVNRGATSETVRLQVAHERVPALSADALYLHAHTADGLFVAARDHYAKPDVPAAEFFYHNGHIALDFAGRGHVVAYLDRFHCQPELDEHIFVDDERRFPENLWNGTGHEDLFDMAWGHKPHSAPLTSGGSQNFQEVNVKLFWNDPLTFRTAVRFNWEWSFKREVPPPRDARFRSVVYFYAQADTPAP